MVYLNAFPSFNKSSNFGGGEKSNRNLITKIEQYSKVENLNLPIEFSMAFFTKKFYIYFGWLFRVLKIYLRYDRVLTSTIGWPVAFIAGRRSIYFVRAYETNRLVLLFLQWRGVRLVFNSFFLKEFYKCKGDVLYPIIHLTPTRMTTRSSSFRNVGCFCHRPEKGLEIIKAISKLDKLRIYHVFGVDGENTPNLKYHGWLETRRALDLVDVLLVPSTWQEPYGRVVVEAVLSAKPVLVSRAGGLVEAVDNRECFIVDDYYNHHEWLKRLEELQSWPWETELYTLKEFLIRRHTDFTPLKSF